MSTVDIPSSAHYLQDVPFPIALHRLLRDNPCPSSIAWASDGTNFYIRDTVDLKDVMESYFRRRTKFDSFKRKLKRHKFHIQRFTTAEGDVSYICSNAYFSRDKKVDCSKHETQKGKYM